LRRPLFEIATGIRPLKKLKCSILILQGFKSAFERLKGVKIGFVKTI